MDELVERYRTHKSSSNQQVLHPYNKQGLGKHPDDPVDHKVWGKDKSFINKERLKKLENNESLYSRKHT